MVKRNILLVAGVFPPGIGGMQNYYYNLCKYSQHNMTVLASAYDGDEAFDAKQSFRVIRKPFLKNEKVSFPNLLKLFHQTKKLIRQEQIDVTIYGYVLFGIIGVFLNLFHKKKYIVAVHGMDVLILNRYFITRWMMKAILRRSSSVMVNSLYNKELVETFGVNPEQIELVYPGVEDGYDQAPKDPELVDRFGLEGKHVLMTLGRLVERKGFDMVIQSMPGILQSIPNAVYLIVGDGKDRSRLVRLAKENGVDKQVIFAGAAPDGELAKYYNLCDVFIMPSRYMKDKGDVEGFGIVYMEAASCFKPAIGGNSGGVKEAVLDGETGLLVDPTSTDSITEAVVRLFSDKELNDRLASHAYHRARTQFHYSMIAKGFDAHLVS